MPQDPTKDPVSATGAWRVAALNPKQEHGFSLEPDADTRAALAEEMGLIALRKLRFQGRLKAEGGSDWVLTGRLGATVVQPCAVTLAPVTTRVEEEVMRRFTPHLPDETEAEEEEIEMPDDDTLELLGTHIDPAAVMAEALALALPLYPRADGAALGELNVTEPGKEAMTDEDVKPFAGLAALKKQLEDDGE